MRALHRTCLTQLTPSIYAQGVFFLPSFLAPHLQLEKRDPEDYDEIEKKYNDLFIQLYYNS